MGIILQHQPELWHENGLDYENGILPEAIRYKIEVSTDEKNWKTVVDKSDNVNDYLIEYETFDMVKASWARLIIYDSGKNIETGVTSFTVFGYLG